MDVMAGKSLDESPVYSCIIPSLFYPFEYENTDSDLNYIDGESLIGKTITVTPSNGDGLEVFIISTLNWQCMKIKLCICLQLNIS